MAETLYRHKKRGTTYRILHGAVMQHSYAENDGPSLDGVAVIVYQDVQEPHKVWVRPGSEFFDGRFEKVVQ